MNGNQEEQPRQSGGNESGRPNEGAGWPVSGPWDSLDDDSSNLVSRALVGQSDERIDAYLRTLTTPPETRYEGRTEFARGGMGAILRVYDHDLRRTLAMKVIRRESGAQPRPSSTQLARFLEEAQVTAQLDHPGIVPVHEVGLDDQGQVYFTMKLVRGEDLRSIFRKVHEDEGGWSRTRALGVLQKVCEAMAFAHERGVIHRDLKPANIMVGRFGEVYVMDWGLARVEGEADRRDLRLRIDVQRSGESVVASHRSEEPPDSPLVTMDGAVLGTPVYMAPEQALGQVSDLGPRSDVYAVGSMLYELLAGESPYLAEDPNSSPLAVLAKVIDGPPRSIAEVAGDIPPELVAVCEKAMARTISHRYENIGDVANDLRAFLEKRVVQAYRTGALVELRTWVRRNSGLAASLCAAVLLLIIGLATSLYYRDRADTAAELAVSQAAEAEELRGLAETRAEQIEINSYIANVQMAQAWLDFGDSSRARERLQQCPEKLRANWEWGWLDSRRDGSTVTLDGHENPVDRIAFSSDGAFLVTGGIRGEVRIWEVASGRCTHQLLGHDDYVTDVAFSPNDQQILTASADATACLWDASTGHLIERIAGHGDILFSADFSPDGRSILTASGDSTARIWDLDGRPLTLLTGHSNRVPDAVFSPDGSKVVTASTDGTARLWDAASGETVQVYSGHEAWLTAVCLNPTGTLLATACWDGTARVWEVASGTTLVELKGHTRPASSICFSGDGAMIATASYDGTARVYDVESGHVLAQLIGHTAIVTSAEFSPDGRFVLTASVDNSARLWHVETGRQLASFTGHEGPVKPAVFSPDGGQIATASSDRTVKLWGLTDAQVTELQHPLPVLSAAFGAEDSLVVTGSADHTARVWDVVTGQCISHCVGHTGDVTSVDFDPGGTLVATSSVDGTACIWDALSAEQACRLVGHTRRVTSIQFDSIGIHVLTASWDGTVRLWEVDTGKCVRVLRDQHARVNSAALNPAGTQIVTGSSDHLVRVWDVASERCIKVLSGHSEEVLTVAYQTSGERFVTACDDDAVCLWDADTFELLSKLNAGDQAVVSHQGNRILCTDQDCSIYDTNTGDRLAFLPHTHGINDVEFSSDDSMIVTASSDHTARIWHSSPVRLRHHQRNELLQATAAVRRQQRDALLETADLQELRKELLQETSYRPLEVRACLAVIQEYKDRVYPPRAFELNNQAWELVDPDRSRHDTDVGLALRLAREAVRLHPVDAALYDTLAWALYANGRPSEALQASKRAIDLAISYEVDDYEKANARLRSLIEGR